MSRRILLPGSFLGLLLAGGVWAPSALAEPKEDLAKTKFELARKAFEATVKALQTGRGDAEQVYRWSRRVMEAQQDLRDKKADQVAALEAHLRRMQELRELAEARYRVGQANQADVLGADFYLAEARLWLAKRK